MDILEMVRQFFLENRPLAPPGDGLKLCADRLRRRTWYGDRFFWAISPEDAVLLGVNRLGLYDETLRALEYAKDDTLVFDLVIEDYRGRKPDVLGKVERISVAEALSRLSRCVTVYQDRAGYTVAHKGLIWVLRYNVSGEFVSADPPIRAVWNNVRGILLPSHAVPEEVKMRFKALLQEEQAPSDSQFRLAS